VILKARCFPKVPVALFTRDPSVVRDAWSNTLAGITLRVALVQYATLATFVTCRAHISLGHSCRQVCDDVIMLTVIQQVDPLRCGYLAVRHGAVAKQTGIHHYPLL